MSFTSTDTVEPWLSWVMTCQVGLVNQIQTEFVNYVAHSKKDHYIMSV